MTSQLINSSSLSRVLILLAGLACVSAGCSSSSVVAPRHAPSGLDLAQAPAWPASYRLSAEGYGAPQNVGLGATGAPSLDAYLKPEVTASRPQRKAPVTRAKTPSIAPAPKLVLPPEVTVPQITQVAVVSATPAANVPDGDRYAARDQQSREQKGFRGGDVVIITSGVVLLVLLIVLLILVLR